MERKVEARKRVALCNLTCQVADFEVSHVTHMGHYKGKEKIKTLPDSL